MSASDFLSAVRSRRTIYGISKDIQVSEERVQEIVREAVKHTPSAFNSQSARVLVLFGEQHDKLWDLTTEILRAIVPADKFESTQQRMGGFRAGYGTILYFEDQAAVEALQAQFPSYAERFPTWSQQSSGMLQYVIWTALELEGLGASLQHYNPLIDEKVRAEWSIPDTWQLIAQMPFGHPTAPPGDKEFKPLEERIKVSR
ncbi:putative oxidoreductase (fatty acid repression mutant protein) [Paenibacillus mucilaginosus]|uniref:nitroreductase family protein n=1 Tax=Paenibacillus mucilaginosus TaxID=61624 RepID=UPI003D19857E